MSAESSRSRRNKLGGRLVVPAVLCGSVLGAASVHADVILSDYGPTMAYNPDNTDGPGAGGAMLSYDGPLNGFILNQVSYASFVTGSQAYLPTSITLAVNTWNDATVYIVPDVNGAPSPINNTYLSESGPSAINNNLDGFTEVNGNFTLTMYPAYDLNADDTEEIPRVLQPNTTYWVAVEQHQQKFGIWGYNDPRSFTYWDLSTDDANASPDWTYISDDYGQMFNGGYIGGPRPAFEIDGTAIPEPTSASLLVLASGIGLLRRRRLPAGY